jgi:hypothetical protein
LTNVISATQLDVPIVRLDPDASDSAGPDGAAAG